MYRNGRFFNKCGKDYNKCFNKLINKHSAILYKNVYYFNAFDFFESIGNNDKNNIYKILKDIKNNKIYINIKVMYFNIKTKEKYESFTDMQKSLTIDEYENNENKILKNTLFISHFEKSEYKEISEQTPILKEKECTISYENENREEKIITKNVTDIDKKIVDTFNSKLYSNRSEKMKKLDTQLREYIKRKNILKKKDTIYVFENKDSSKEIYKLIVVKKGTKIIDYKNFKYTISFNVYNGNFILKKFNIAMKKYIYKINDKCVIDTYQTNKINLTFQLKMIIDEDNYVTEINSIF